MPNVTVRIDAFGQTHTVVTDNDEGFFELTINPPNDLPAFWPGVVSGSVFAGGTVTQPDLAETEPSGKPVVKDGYLMVSHHDFSQFGVISDIDDTVLVTDATNLLANG